MRRPILKVVIAGAMGFIIAFASLSTITNFVLVPALTACGLMVLSAIASYVPRNGVRLIVSSTIIGAAFMLSMFATSAAFSAVPQPSGPFVIPMATTATAFLLLVIYGSRRYPTDKAMKYPERTL